MTERINATGIIDIIKKNGRIVSVIPVESGDIGQGYGFRSDLSFGQAGMDDVLYIPEADWALAADGGEECGYYTKRKFLEIVSDDPENPSSTEYELAEDLYLSCDWQYPETLCDEWLGHGEVARCPECGLTNTPGGPDAAPERCPVCGSELEYDGEFLANQEVRHG